MTSEPKKLLNDQITFPNPDAKKRFDDLHGIDLAKNKLVAAVRVILNPSALKQWSEKSHPKAKRLVDYVLKRPQLFALVGDVGTGKTSLAETFGDAVARAENINVHFFKLSLSVRGTGTVGEMTTLITAAFDEVAEMAKKVKSSQGGHRAGYILLIDEADAIAQSRETAQMHHEDRAGVNALIRGIDRFGHEGLPAVVIICTNRSEALDPAVKRRAGEIIEFNRPNNAQIKNLLHHCFEGLDFSPTQIETLSHAMGPTEQRPYGFTYSDVTQRLLPAIILDAYPKSPLQFDKILAVTREMVPTAPFKERTK